MKKLPIGIQTFEQLINDGYVYVDKTAFVYKMINEGKTYFLSRPRRFGKSLLLSTIKAVFQRKKKLFTGLAIEKKVYDWQEYPVIHLDFSTKEIKSKEDIDLYLRKKAEDLSIQYSLNLKLDLSVDLLFEDLIIKLATLNNVVFLVDEYDAPILNTLPDLEQCTKIKDKLKSFYTTIKSCDEYLKFVFLTGVSKFAKISVFSGLNNLSDLSMHPEYASICGYTENELDLYFKDRIETVVKKQNFSVKKLREKMKTWYNGFRFSKIEEYVYNPISVLKLFDIKEFEQFWFKTATPTFLINLIKEKDYIVSEIEKLELTDTDFDVFDIEKLEIEPLLFQTGYITIKDYNKEDNLFTLSYPNYEVREAFLKKLLLLYSPIEDNLGTSTLLKLIKSLKSEDLTLFFTLLKAFFANIPYDLHVKNEKYYQTIFYLLFSIIGLKVKAEHKTNKGRIDAVIETEKAIYIFEFKLFDTAANALKQIKTIEYYQMYKGIGKKLYLVGVQFSSEEKNIDQWIVEEEC